MHCTDKVVRDSFCPTLIIIELEAGVSPSEIDWQEIQGRQEKVLLYIMHNVWNPWEQVKVKTTGLEKCMTGRCVSVYLP